MTRSTRATQALDLVLALHELVARDLRRFEQQHGLTGPRVHLLWLLGQAGPLTQRALADGLGVSPRNVTGLVDALVASGHLTREPHPHDRRATLVTLTPSAAEFVADLQHSHADLARRLFGELPEGQLTQFAEVLEATLTRFAALMEEDA